jgi:hypothetical protein
VNLPRAFVVLTLSIVIGTAMMTAGRYFLQSPRPKVAAAPPNALSPPVPKASAFGWKLVGAMHAHRAMVLEVETTRPGEAVAIAQQLTEPYKDRFDEVLVFFFQPDANPRRAIVRVQWTRTRGYRTLTLRALQ